MFVLLGLRKRPMPLSIIFTPINPVLYPPPLILPRSGWNARNPGGSKQNGRNLVGLQVNSNLSPSKRKKKIKCQILNHPLVIPDHSGWNPAKRKKI